MSVIAQSELKKLIREGVIKIEPFSEDQLGPASIDLHIGNHFLVYKKVWEIYHITEDSDFEHVTQKLTVKDHFLLMPGESVMGMTLEKITLPDHICALPIS